MPGRAIKLAGTVELADETGLTRSRVSALARHPEAPEPLVRLKMGPVYDMDRMLAFIRTRRPSGPRPMTPAAVMRFDVELAGVYEIAEATGQSRRQVSQDLQRADAPRPLARLRMGPVYHRDPVVLFVLSRHGTAKPSGGGANDPATSTAA